MTSQATLDGTDLASEMLTMRLARSELATAFFDAAEERRVCPAEIVAAMLGRLDRDDAYNALVTWASEQTPPIDTLSDAESLSDVAAQCEFENAICNFQGAMAGLREDSDARRLAEAEPPFDPDRDAHRPGD